jgi:segregation and condensation protein A
MDSFAKAFMAFLLKKQRLEEMHRTYERVERARMSMENRIVQMTDLFRTRKTVKFSEMIKNDDSPFNRVITFMSLLELLKQRSVTAEQKKRFGDITIKRVETGGSND